MPVDRARGVAFLLRTFLWPGKEKYDARPQDERKLLLSSVPFHAAYKWNGTRIENHSPSVNNDALPPAAVVLIVSVRSVVKRSR